MGRFLHEPFLQLAGDSQAQKTVILRNTVLLTALCTSRPTPQTSRAHPLHPSHARASFTSTWLFASILPGVCSDGIAGVSAAKPPSLPHLVLLALSRKEDFTQFPLEKAGQLLSHHISPGGTHLCSEAVCVLKTFSNSGETQTHTCHKVFHSAR